MRQLQVKSFQWLTALFAGLLGTMILVSPHQYQLASYPGAIHGLYVLGACLLFISLFMLAAIIFLLPEIIERVVYLFAAVFFIFVGLNLARLGGIFTAVNLIAVGGGSLVLAVRTREPFQVDQPHGGVKDPALRKRELHLLVIGVSALVNGALLLSYQEIHSYYYTLDTGQSNFFGLLFLASGAFWLSSQAIRRTPVWLNPIFQQTTLSLYTGVVFLLFIVLTIQPGKFWLGTVFYGWFGLNMLLPAQSFMRAENIDSTRLHIRLTAAVAVATTLPLVLTVAVLNYLSDTSVQVVNVEALRQMRDIILGFLLLLAALSVYAGTRLANWLASPLERLSWAAMAMTFNDMTAPLQDSSVTEIRHLVQSFEMMRSRLERRTAEREMALRGLDEYRAHLEQRVAERTLELQISNQRLEAVLRALPVGVFIADENGTVRPGNASALQILGAHPNLENVGASDSLVQAWWSSSRSLLQQQDWALWRAFHAGETVHGDMIDVPSHEGAHTTILYSAAPIRDEAGKVTGAVGLVQDISHQRQLEVRAREFAREAHRSAVQVEAIFNAMTDAVVVYNQNSIVLQANPQAIALLGFDPVRMTREMVGQKLTIKKIQSGESLTEMLPADRVLAGETSVNKRMVLTNARGRSYAVLSSTSPVYVGSEVIGYVDIWHDITEREKLLAENNRQRELLERLVARAPIGIAFLSGDDLRFTLVNPAYAHIARGVGELVGLRIEDVWPETKADILPLFYQVLQTGESVEVTNHALLLAREGSAEEISISFSLTPILDEQGKIDGVMELLVETTEEVRARRAVEEEHTRLLAILENVPEGIVMVNQNGLVLISNPASHDLFGQELDGKRLSDAQVDLPCYDPNGEPMPRESFPLLMAVQRGGTFQNVEMLLERPDGQKIPVVTNAAPVIDPAGHIQGAVATFMDISGIIRAERALRESEERFRGLVESIDDIVVTLDTEANFTGLFGRSLMRYGLSPEETIGLSVFSLVDQSDPSYQALFHKLVAGSSTVFEVSAQLRNEQIDFQVSASPQRDENDKVIGVVAVARDITAIKQTENALERYTRQLQRSNRELEQFAFIASHDLQEPLRKIHAFSERIRSRVMERGEAEEQDYLERMINASNRMQKMIEDLLAFSRVTTKGQPFERVDLNQVTAEVIIDLELRIERTAAALDIGVLPTIEADRMQMHQLLQNLIGNALKYHDKNRKPRIHIYAEVVGRPESNEADHIRLVVADNGIGFDPQYLERIFQPFERLHGRSEYEGTGMGLAICQKIVERHNGTITAESQPGQGAKFFIDLPVRQKNT